MAYRPKDGRRPLMMSYTTPTSSFSECQREPEAGTTSDWAAQHVSDTSSSCVYPCATERCSPAQQWHPPVRQILSCTSPGRENNHLE